jgi:hypothetical protein
MSAFEAVAPPRPKSSFSQKVGRVFVEAFPDAGGETFRVVVFIEEVLKASEELGNDALRAFGRTTP